MIRVKEVSVIGTDGEQIGTLPTREAIALAQDQD
jgi:translation initiation factor IF-3